jgi:hypothetical protein
VTTSKSDELAKRFADRLHKTPSRGRVIIDETDDQSAERQPVDRGSRRASVPHPSQGRVERLGRGASGARLRGHLVPHTLHADARRIKLSQQARRGRRVTWDDVATEALELLLAHRAEVARRLTEVRRLADQATVGPRLVQATIPTDLDEAFGELRLDLADEIGHDISYEQLWAAALLIWLRTHR